MLMVKYLMLVVGAGLMAAALGMMLFELPLASSYQIAKMRTPKEGDAELVPPEPL